MTRLDPNPPAGLADPGFAAIEAALSTLAEPAPDRLINPELVVRASSAAPGLRTSERKR